MSIEYLLSELDKQAKFKGDLKDDALLYLLQDGVDYALDILKLAKKINSKISIETEGLAKGGINGDSGTGTINVPAATLEQAIEGKSSDVAITPETLQAKIDDALKDISSVTFATKDQAWEGLSEDTVISPSVLAAAAPQKDRWGVTNFPGDLVYKKDGRKHISLMNESGTHEMYLYAEDGAVSLNMGDQASTEVILHNGLVTVIVGGKSFNFYGNGAGSGNFASQGDVIAFEGSTKSQENKKDNSHYYPDSMPIDPETYDLIHIMRVLAWHIDELRDEVNELREQINKGA